MTTGENALATLANRYEHCAGPAGSSRCRFFAETSSRAATTLRRSRTGLEPGKNQQTLPIEIFSHSRYDNVVANVLGTAGYHTSYEFVTPTTPTFPACNQSIFVLGYASECGSDPTVPNDPLAASTLLRWGNYDVVTGAARWNASEVPSTLGAYANPVPTTHALPASLYLSAKPANWWGTTPWPAIGPDVAGGQDSTGHAYNIPARACFENTAKDANGILTFNASNCY